MDSFKGSLRASAACEAVRRGILAEIPGAEVVSLPMADGGEGTAEAVLSAGRGEWRSKRVSGPLPGMRVEARYAWLPEGPQALVEVSTASGLELLDPSRLDPLAATTFGTGELLADAARSGANQLRLALGGSATVDGGVGAAMALGWRFLDANGRSVGLGGAELERIASIEPPASQSVTGGPGTRMLPPLEVLCDVDNPLLGPRGAARIFGPQKGADPSTVERLERGLARLSDLVERDLGLDVRELPGGGAAGGLGAGAVAFLGGKLVPGVVAVMATIGLEEALEGADWVVTGEGRYDEQSLHGKVVSGVVRLAARKRVPVAVIAGTSDLSPEQAEGVSAVEVAAPAGLPATEAMARAGELVFEASRRLARVRLGGRSRPGR